MKIIFVLGSPTEKQVRAMNPHYEAGSVSFPNTASVSWRETLSAPDDAIDLISKVLLYEPKKRLTAKGVIAHKFFAELRDGRLDLEGLRLPQFAGFTHEELEVETELNEILVPEAD